MASTNFGHHVEYRSNVPLVGSFNRKNVYVVGSKKIERVLELEFRGQCNIPENLLSKVEKENRDWYDREGRKNFSKQKKVPKKFHGRDGKRY
jgi:hypothetical protein